MYTKLFGKAAAQTSDIIYPRTFRVLMEATIAGDVILALELKYFWKDGA